MLKYLKRIFFTRNTKLPEIEVIDFRDGLLRFRSACALPLSALTVRTNTPAGTIEARVDIQSYDPGNQVYLAAVSETDDTLESLNVDISELSRLKRVLRVSSRDLPAYVGLTEEISLGGLRISTGKALEPGAQLELNIELDDPQQSSLKVNAEVHWSAHKGDGTCHSGLRFRGIDSSTFRRLAQYIQARRAVQQEMN